MERYLQYEDEMGHDGCLIYINLSDGDLFATVPYIEASADLEEDSWRV